MQAVISSDKSEIMAEAHKCVSFKMVSNPFRWNLEDGIIRTHIITRSVSVSALKAAGKNPSGHRQDQGTRQGLP